MKLYDLPNAGHDPLTLEEDRQLKLMIRALELSQLTRFIRVLGTHSKPLDVNIKAIWYAGVQDEMVRFVAPSVKEKLLPSTRPHFLQSGPMLP